MIQFEQWEGFEGRIWKEEAVRTVILLSRFGYMIREGFYGKPLICSLLGSDMFSFCL